MCILGSTKLQSLIKNAEIRLYTQLFCIYNTEYIL